MRGATLIFNLFSDNGLHRDNSTLDGPIPDVPWHSFHQPLCFYRFLDTKYSLICLRLITILS